MNSGKDKSIRNRLALALWGTALLAFVVVGIVLALFQRFTLEQRARQIMEPYAQLVSVGTDAAVAFEDPQRAQEILDTLRANPHIREASIYLADGRPLASFSRLPNAKPGTMPIGADGITLDQHKAELLQSLSSGARLRLDMDLEQLSAQSQQAMWIFGAGVLVLLAVTLVQLAVLRRTIVRPIGSLTEAAELVRTHADYQQRIPVAGTDELARLGRSFNAMMAAIQERQDELRRLNRELLAISDCNQVLVRAEDEQFLLDEICRIVCDKAGYVMAWVGYADRDAGMNLRIAARAGNESGYLERLVEALAKPEYRNTPPVIALRTGAIASIDDFANAPEVADWRDSALQRGYRSAIALPLKDKTAPPFGVLTIYSTELKAFTPEEQRLLGELADDLAFGIVTLRARTEHARAEEQIQIAATAFEAQEGIVITDADQVILRVNRAFADITGYAAEEVIGATPRLLSSGHHDASFYRTMWSHVNDEGSWQGEIWNRRKNGDLYPEWLNITAVKNAQGQVSHYVGTMIDITERKAAERKIEHLAFYDLLTGLPNRRLFVDRLQQAMGGSARSRRMGALLFIDLDNFKIVNDTCGHDVGDRLLVEVARRLSACVRDGDTISRLGGDEFVAMLEDLSDSPQEAAAQARRAAAKVLETLAQPYSIAGRVHHSTPSIGATLFVGNQDSVDELLKQADIAMYQAKSAGRNTLRFFDPEMQAAVAARAGIEAALRQGIDEHQFLLHYQPQVDGMRGIIGAEVLLRWQHPERGMISPAQFIPLAEETGLILAIGRWVLECACAQLAAWSQDPATSALQLAVNVSARQFRQADFVDSVRAALEDSRAPALRLKLELTETLVLDDVEDTIEKMHALRKLGVGFSMDDFGTGYSSLSYLTRLPLDQLKIDQSFVRNLPDSATDAVVVQSIITLARSLGLTVIAEGVETEAQRRFLDQHGCPIYQGYLFSRPVPLAAFAELLARR